MGAVKAPTIQELPTQIITIIGLDIAKFVFQVHGDENCAGDCRGGISILRLR